MLKRKIDKNILVFGVAILIYLQSIGAINLNSLMLHRGELALCIVSITGGILLSS